MAFFGTAYGKEPYGNTGSTIKRLITRSGLQKLYKNQITMPYELFTWVSEQLKNVHCYYVTITAIQLDFQRCRTKTISLLCFVEGKYFPFERKEREISV